MSWRNLKAKNEGQYLSLEIRKITQEDLHDFNADFTTYYAKELSQGYNLMEQYNREIEGYINDFPVFKLFTMYTNAIGKTMTVESIDGENVVIEMDGEKYEGILWKDYGNRTECICSMDCLWWASDLEDNENEL